MAENNKTYGIVLAAGKGKRLRSKLPKVLHRVAGRTLLGHVVSSLGELGLDRIVCVSSDIDRFKEVLAGEGLGETVEHVLQDPPSGTGDAVRLALEHLGDVSGSVFVVAGDAPLIRASTLGSMLETHEAAAAGATLLTAQADDATGYGRIVRGPGGEVERIVEDADATDEEKALREINTATYVFDVNRLNSVIAKIDKENRQGEYYLTDVIELLRAGGDPLVAFEGDIDESHGVNTRTHLALVRKLLHQRVCEHWMEQGVTIFDPSVTYIDVTVEIGSDAVIHPMTFLEGKTSIAERAEVGPQARVVDSSIGPEANVSFAVIRESTIGPQASVGPFASLRPGTTVGKGSRVGTFVETKQTVIGDSSKANHLAYLGDAEIGTGVNIGAGTITCNWDGQEKHKTVIEDDAYIGSDTMLVAPTHIGKRAATGAGAVVRGDVPDDALAVGVPARVIEGKGDKLGHKQGKMKPEATPAKEEDAASDS